MMISRDISIGGLFLVKNEDEVPAVGSRVSIKFVSAPGFERVLQGKIQRLTENGAAVTFIDFDLDDLQFINRLIAASYLKLDARGG
jgi:hypothetical protein